MQSTGYPVLLLLTCVTLLGGEEIAGRSIHVSPTGDDDHDGSDATPLRTISKAAESAQPGDTVLVYPGVYRERVAPPRGGVEGRPITFRGTELGKVFVRGSNEWKPEWKKHQGGVFFARPNRELFDDDVYHDSANPFLVPLASTPYTRDGQPEFERYKTGDPNLAYTCGQVILNGRPLTQRPFLSEVEKHPKSWTFVPDENASETGTGHIYVHFGDATPSEQVVEISTRRRIFAPHTRGLGHIVVEGFVFEHCGNQYPTNFWSTPKWAQAGAIGFRGGHHWVFRRNVVRYVATVALDMGRSGGDNERKSDRVSGPHGANNSIVDNWFVDNGSAAIIGSGSLNMLIRGNVILRNNTLRFVGKKRYEHAGIKCHDVRHGLIERNYVADSPLSEGIWLDNQFPETRVTRNVVVGNGARGIFLEMSDYRFDRAFVDHNISLANRGAQFYVHDASGSTVLHNLFANSPKDAKYGQGCYIYQVNARTKTGYHSLYGNIFVQHKTMLDINYPSHRSGPQRLDHNVYDASKDERAFWINSASDRPSPWKPEDFFELVREEVGREGPEKRHGGSKVALTLDEWRAFWAKHGQTNDRASVTHRGMKVEYDRQTHELTLTLPFDPASVGSTPHRILDDDFFGRPVPQDGKARPGPFQDVRRGQNAYRIWNGQPLLAEGELPRAKPSK